MPLRPLTTFEFRLPLLLLPPVSLPLAVDVTFRLLIIRLILPIAICRLPMLSFPFISNFILRRIFVSHTSPLRLFVVSLLRRLRHLYFSLIILIFFFCFIFCQSRSPPSPFRHAATPFVLMLAGFTPISLRHYRYCLPQHTAWHHLMLMFALCAKT